MDVPTSAVPVQVPAAAPSPSPSVPSTPARADVGHDPRTGVAHEPVAHSTPAEVEAALAAAASAARPVAQIPPAERAAWLDAVATALEAHVEELAALADAETALGFPRLPGELTKAAAQARFYGSVASEGGLFGAVVDHAAGAPPIDLRRASLPTGPVAVFGASNFPFGFGTVGHDTCSALAAGCPVVVKAHPAHPRTAARLAEIVRVALRDAGAPEGTFGSVTGFEAGLTLVDDARITAVGFTGSQHGGMALVDRAARRGSDGGPARPIPVYAEMGTVNPGVVTHEGVRVRHEEIVAGFVASMTLGSGQFCTKPGLLLVPAGSGTAEAVAAALADVAPTFALTRGIAEAYAAGVAELRAAGARAVDVPGAPVSDDASASGGFGTTPTVMVVDAEALAPGSRFVEECFGPAALVVEYSSTSERDAVLRRLQPSLAAAVASGGPDDPETPALVDLLSARVGRVAVDGWPTGAAGTWAQQHGGPWPATSRPEASSVGAAALSRWLRPVAYQNVPDAALPPALQDANPWGLPRRVDGVHVPAPTREGGAA
ncbi:aldehyde dehydrogenase family protein [Mobilicoccus pelagius]|uniref:Putative aldehyde dehydrogenase n=1 Tax=Mobilicoccus pelagius NBRC 104925 TaxID=1089455 RepID=H5UU49_9MICO|nr:aldehyde dehydrogenase family protein [Mobilicoccus pelagius]GAB49257.1 putative aldehyde dehydrogenase [Mobilicoccus pelagius NBRC 104925]